MKVICQIFLFCTNKNEAEFGNQTRVTYAITLVGSECSHHYAILAPKKRQKPLPSYLGR